MKLSRRMLAAGTGLAWLAAAYAAGGVNTPALISQSPQIESRRGDFEVPTGYLQAKISLNYPGFEALSVDSLGEKHFALVPMKPPPEPWRPIEATRHADWVEYRSSGATGPPGWTIEIKPNTIQLVSRWSPEDPPEPLALDAENRACHVTLLGLINPDGSIRLPAIMHFPNQGSFQVSVRPLKNLSLGYTSTRGERGDVKIIFPAATPEHPLLEYRLKVVAIYPNVRGIGSGPRFDVFRRDWLDIFQISPKWRVLANNASSDSCGFCYYEYGDIAQVTPPLVRGLTALDLVRQTLDRIIGGFNACGMPGYSPLVIHREDRPECSADTFPSLLIAAEDYVQGSHDEGWLATNYVRIESWTDQMLATDRSGDGLIKYILSGDSGSWLAKTKYRPANWWDTIGFGHEDAYANALAYRALRGMEKLARRSGHADDEVRYRAGADRLKAAYFKTFYDPATGVLAGWKSADGRLHDYYFPWVNGIAIHYGLVPKDRANQIMDHLLAKMKAVGYTNFALGLPGNLIPVSQEDYLGHYPGFQIYENGGATACFSYFTLAALYDLDRIQDGDRILFPMLQSFAEGNFQGWELDGKSKDWKMWDGTCKGYEGMLTDNYYALLAVLDRQAALQRGSQNPAVVPSR